MRSIRELPVTLILLGGLAAAPVQAETFHTCGTTIASVPTVITTAGVYCLSHDVNTAITSGSAIAINSNNVTLDCNGYKIGGLAAGSGSNTIGVYAASARQNITVRNCGIRGFLEGIDLAGGAGHLVEDNRLDNNLYAGIVVQGDNNRIRRNAVYDTGGNSTADQSFGISASGDVIDNTVAGVFDIGPSPNNRGILMTGDSTEARGNQVRGIATSGSGEVAGIIVYADGVTLRNNSVSEQALTFGEGIFGAGSSNTICTGNTIFKFSAPITFCQDGGGNASN